MCRKYFNYAIELNSIAGPQCTLFSFSVVFHHVAFHSSEVADGVILQDENGRQVGKSKVTAQYMGIFASVKSVKRT